MTPFCYDRPFSGDGGYANTGGRLAFAETCDGASCALPTTRLAFGYDVQGRQQIRDEWLSALSDFTPPPAAPPAPPPPPPPPHRTVFAYQHDGALLSTALTSRFLVAPLSYNNDYDASGRLSRVYGSTIALSGTMNYWQSFFDDQQRLSRADMDSGQVRATWSYSSSGGSGRMTGYAIGASSASAAGSSTDAPCAAGQTTWQPLICVSGMTYKGEKLASYDESGARSHFNFSYDDDGRLAQATATKLDSSTPPMQQIYDQRFTAFFNGDGTANFAAGGGRSLGTLRGLNSTMPNPANPPQSVTSSSQYDYSPAEQVNQVETVGVPALQVGYDPDQRGLMTTVGQDTFTYDAANRLKSITGAETNLSYDAFGSLVSRTFSDGRIVVYIGANMTITKTGSGVATARAEVLAGGLRVASVAGAGSILFYHRDRQGSVIGTTTRTATGSGNSVSSVGASYRYDPYGAVAVQTGDSVV